MNKIFMIGSRQKTVSEPSNFVNNRSVLGRAATAISTFNAAIIALRHLAASATHCYTRQFMARQRLGQHFLGDMGWRKRILATLPIAANETWVEIGPGHGEMTQLLSGDGRRVIAIESDAKLAESLRASVDTQAGRWPGVEIVSGDVLTADIGSLAGGKFHVYGNLPVLHHVADSASSIRLGRSNRFDSRRDSIGSGAAHRRASRRPRLRLSFHAVPILFRAENRFTYPTGCFSPATPGAISSGYHDPPWGARETQRSR